MALTVAMFGGGGGLLGLPPTTIKVGIMDEEKRTSLNLEACIEAARDRVIFINTGFLDRTGDEIHSDFQAGALVRKNDMKSTVWLNAYEDRNVDVALAAGFRGQAQIGKGMWAKPAAMAEMVAQKIAHPLAGANCAWVPSPTAATLHALHYLRVNVAERQESLAGRTTRIAARLLEVPVLSGPLTAEQVDHELRTNAQSILGYVVRWVGLGVGLLDGARPRRGRPHGGSRDAADLEPTHRELAASRPGGRGPDAEDVRGDGGAGRPAERGRTGLPSDGHRPGASESFQAALDLVFTGRTEPNGYTERALTTWRRKAKARAGD